MGTDRTARPRDTRGEVLMVAMLGTAAVLTGLVAAMAVIGGWLALALTIALLLTASTGVVLVVMRLLDEDGDPRPVVSREPEPARVVASSPMAGAVAPA